MPSILNKRQRWLVECLEKCETSDALSQVPFNTYFFLENMPPISIYLRSVHFVFFSISAMSETEYGPMLMLQLMNVNASSMEPILDYFYTGNYQFCFFSTLLEHSVAILYKNQLVILLWLLWHYSLVTVILLRQHITIWPFHDLIFS